MASLIDRRGFVALGAAVAVDACRMPGRASARARAPQTLEEAMRGPVIRRGSPDFAAASELADPRFDEVMPLAVARPLDARDVSGAVRWAHARNVRLVARSGGHSYAGYSTVQDGVVLDLRLLRSIHVDRTAGTATIGAGELLIDVYAGLAKYGATIPAGTCPSVGIAGLTLGGGMGFAGRAFGLTADHLVGAQIVTAAGRVRSITHRTDPDLLWALRGGGGGNFGVVTDLRFRLQRLPRSASWFHVDWPWSSAGDAIDAWQSWAPHARDTITAIMRLDAGRGATGILLDGQYLGPAADLASLLGPLAAVPGASVTMGDQDYLGLQMRWAGCVGQSVAACHEVGSAAGGMRPRASYLAKSDYVSRPLSAAGRNALIGAMEARLAQPGSASVVLDSYGGAINRVSPHATAFVHRDRLFLLQYISYQGDIEWLRATRASMAPYVSGYAYQNYIDAELPNWKHSYYGSNYAKLVDVRRRVDPHHFFRFPQAIG